MMVRQSVLILFVVLGACAPGPDTGLEGGDGQADTASAVFYDCSSSVVDARTGKPWTYDTSWFNNNVGSHPVFVSELDGDTLRGYPPIEVKKIGTDTWQDDDGRVTVKLVQDGAHKRIRVQHHSLGLETPLHNGTCDRAAPDLSRAQAHSFLYGGRWIVNGSWRAVAAGDSPVTVEPHPIFELEQSGALDDPYRVTGGSLRFARRCDFATHADLSVASSGVTPEASIGRLGNVAGVLGFKFVIEQLIEMGRCALDDDGFIQQTLITQYMLMERGNPADRHASDELRRQCGESSDTLYLVVKAAGSYDVQAVACARIFEPAGDSSVYLQLKAAAPGSTQPTEWITFVKE